MKRSVDEQATDAGKNKHLCWILTNSSLFNYKKFINCLLQTNQHHVGSLLDPSLVGDIRPLSDEQQSRLKKNYPKLVSLIYPKGGLIGELYPADCITWRQKEYIEHPLITKSESNTRLINNVRRGSETNFNKFLEYLNKTGQQHVSEILMKDGTVVHIVAKSVQQTTENKKKDA